MPSTPATTDRPLTPAGERLLDVATDLFYARGIHTVGVDEIAEVAGTTKKTLYDQFRSKDRLVVAYLRRRAERWRAFCIAHLDEHAPEPGPARVLAVYEALARWHAGNQRGCAFVNAWAELGGTDHAGCEVVREDKRWMHALFERLVGELRDPDIALGAQLHLLYEGALVVSTAGGREAAIDEARTAAASLLNTSPAGPASTGRRAIRRTGR